MQPCRGAQNTQAFLKVCRNGVTAPKQDLHRNYCCICFPLYPQHIALAPTSHRESRASAELTAVSSEVVQPKSPGLGGRKEKLGLVPQEGAAPRGPRLQSPGEAVKRWLQHTRHCRRQLKQERNGFQATALCRKTLCYGLPRCHPTTALQTGGFSSPWGKRSGSCFQPGAFSQGQPS